MRRIFVDGAAAAALLSAAFVAVLVFRPADWQLALDAWLLALGAVALAASVAATRAGSPGPGESPFDRRRRGRRAAEEDRLPELERIERIVSLGTGTAFDVHYRLRPVLREVAEHRLASRRGLALDSGSEPVQEALGAELWEIVRPDRERPDHNLAKGLTAARIGAAIERLERI